MSGGLSGWLEVREHAEQLGVDCGDLDAVAPQLALQGLLNSFDELVGHEDSALAIRPYVQVDQAPSAGCAEVQVVEVGLGDGALVACIDQHTLPELSCRQVELTVVVVLIAHLPFLSKRE